MSNIQKHKTITGYFVVTTNQLHELEPEILACRSKGYELHGPLIILPDDTAPKYEYGVRFFQAMVKYTEEVKSNESNSETKP